MSAAVEIVTCTFTKRYQWFVIASEIKNSCYRLSHTQIIVLTLNFFQRYQLSLLIPAHIYQFSGTKESNAIDPEYPSTSPVAG